MKRLAFFCLVLILCAPAVARADSIQWAGQVTASTLPDLFPVGTLVTATASLSMSSSGTSYGGDVYPFSASSTFGAWTFSIQGNLYMHCDDGSGFLEPGAVASMWYTTMGTGGPFLSSYGGISYLPRAVFFVCGWWWGWPNAPTEGDLGSMGPYRLQFDDGNYVTTDLEVVPEPASLLLLGTGLVGVVRVVRRKRA